ncbi:helix-turn-helix domain-containing protein [Leuconostoc mesenteroides]|uniref:helix-turn-helix domain-containing protein n=1 Tax=Leuconostoc mesenteroides TaxID=1245 RepID=UPI002073D51A|nr:helix-turn-helix transcriptional regulator [Leuconostoc mesenteroides]MCM6833189.1 helix-turn-helix domain-containing protein [Leuconostoc mesenteroides]
MVTKEQFGQKIKHIREKKHYTVRQAALQGNFSSAYLSQIENGNKNIPKVETLYRIAKGLRISKDEILHIAGITSHTSPKHPNSVDLGKQFADDDLLLSFEGKPLSPEYREAILSILRTLPNVDEKTKED